MTQTDHPAEILEILEILEGAGTQTWLMRHPPVNAISPDLLDAFDAAITAVEGRDDISVIVLASDLRVFSAGADATWMAETVANVGSSGLVDIFNETMDRFRAVCLALQRLPVLVIAALEGHTLAGGLELAAACDLRFCTDAERTQLGVPEMDLFGAMPTGGGGAQYLARLIGPARALDFILEAKPITPEQAARLGIVERIYPAGTVRAEAERFATEVARKAGRIGVNAAKRAVFDGARLPLEQALEQDGTLHWDAMRRGNFTAGVDAFVAKFGRPKA